MHFRKILASDTMSAEDFVDGNFTPCEHTLTLKEVTMEKPPAGGKPKGCFHFEGTEKKMFVANGEIKKLARLLRRADTNDWIGARITFSSAEKKFAGQPVTGIIITKAELPGKAPANATR